MVLFVAVTVVTYVIFYVTPSDPARLAAGQGATPEDVQRVAERLHLDEPVWQQYGRFLKQLVVEQSLGHVVRQPAGRERHRPARRAGHGLARLRRRRPLAAALDPDRDPLGAEAPLADRPGGDGLRPDRHLGAPGLDRADLRLLLRLQVPGVGPAAHADHGLLRLLQPLAGARRARAVGVPHDPALADVRDPVRRALRAPDPGERDGDDERGLRAHRARQGRTRARR